MMLSFLKSCHIFFSDDWRVKLYNWHWNGFQWPAMWSSSRLPNLARLLHKLPLPIWPHHIARRDLLTLQSACVLQNKAQRSRQFLLSSLPPFLLQSYGLSQGEAQGSVPSPPTRDLEKLSFLEGRTANISWVWTQCLKTGASFVSFCKSRNITIPEKNHMGVDSDREQNMFIWHFLLHSSCHKYKNQSRQKALLVTLYIYLVLKLCLFTDPCVILVKPGNANCSLSSTAIATREMLS